MASIVVVGGGLAGLVCGYRLVAASIVGDPPPRDARQGAAGPDRDFAAAALLRSVDGAAVRDAIVAPLAKHAAPAERARSGQWRVQDGFDDINAPVWRDRTC